MKIITHYICPPIPVRCADWVAYIDPEDGIAGHGATELDALDDLLWQARSMEEQDAIEAAIAEREKANG